MPRASTKATKNSVKPEVDPSLIEGPAPAPAASSDSETSRVSILPLRRAVAVVPIVGITPLIPHKWSEKALRMMRDKQTGATASRVKNREAKDPDAEAEASLYKLADGQPGMPATAFKASLVGACRLVEGLPMTRAKLLFFVEGEGPEQLVRIEGDSDVHEDTPRNATGVADLRYRHYIGYSQNAPNEPWRATLKIQFLRDQIDVESVVNLVNAAGVGGVGDWRPSAPKSASGIYGQFRVDGEQDLKVMDL